MWIKNELSDNTNIELWVWKRWIFWPGLFHAQSKMIPRRLNNLPALLLGMKIYYSQLSVDGRFRRKTERILNIVDKKARRKD